MNYFPITYFGGENEIDWVSAKRMEVSILILEDDKRSNEKNTFDNQHAQYEIEDRFFICKRSGKELDFKVKDIESLPRGTPQKVM